MNWEQAQVRILNTITIDIHLDPRSRYKFIRAVPPYVSNMSAHMGKAAFRVQVGQNSHIDIPLEMLKVMHTQATLNNSRVYDKQLFERFYPNEYKNKPCYVQAIGKLFLRAGVATPIGSTKYQII